ncbi:heavy metal-binding domain-containing protein, partial [Nocardioides sp.]|uniref:YHS domain-containing protein n=1 Tax=Nocardioides sp. TaxID=35761 RepID=UPI00262AE915
MASHSNHHEARPIPTVKDPVCGMDVNPATSTLTAAHEGETFHFCSAGCQSKFEANPDQYAGHADHNHQDHAAHDAAEVPPGAEVAEYTCPMHPEIRQPGPGSCPICGMALEPALVTADSAPNAELADMTRRFWVGVVLSIPVLILGMGGDL